MLCFHEVGPASEGFRNGMCGVWLENVGAEAVPLEVSTQSEGNKYSRAWGQGVPRLQREDLSVAHWVLTVSTPPVCPQTPPSCTWLPASACWSSTRPATQTSMPAPTPPTPPSRRSSRSLSSEWCVPTSLPPHLQPCFPRGCSLGRSSIVCLLDLRRTGLNESQSLVPDRRPSGVNSWYFTDVAS